MIDNSETRWRELGFSGAAALANQAPNPIKGTSGGANIGTSNHVA